MSGWTKRQFVVKAFGKIGLASFVFDLSPEQEQDALSDLDSMMATWNTDGIRVGYPLPSSQAVSSLDQATDVPDSANEAIFSGLAIRLAPGYGKTVSPDTKVIAKQAYDTLYSKAQGEPIEQQLPSTLPAGAGNKGWRNNQGPFVTPPDDPLTTGQDSAIDFD